MLNSFQKKSQLSTDPGWCMKQVRVKDGINYCIVFKSTDMIVFILLANWYVTFN